MSEKWINDIEEAKDLLLAVLLDRPKGNTMDLVKFAWGKAHGDSNITRISFDPDTWLKIDGALLELFQRGIIIPGSHHGGLTEGFGLYRLSQFGQDYIRTGHVAVYSKTRFMKQLETHAPGIDPIAKMYIHEAQNTFHGQAYLATSVMVGCASERLINLLEQAFLKYLELTNPSEREKLSQALKKSRGIASRRQEIITRLRDKLKSILPNEDTNSLLNAIEKSFAAIGETRNDVGHPTGRTINSEEAAVILHQVLIYAPKLRRIIIALVDDSAWNGNNVD